MFYVMFSQYKTCAIGNELLKEAKLFFKNIKLNNNIYIPIIYPTYLPTYIGLCTYLPTYSNKYSFEFISKYIINILHGRF